MTSLRSLSGLLRPTIGTVMIGVAILAVMFAVFGVEYGAILTTVYLVILSPVPFFPPGRRLLVSAWIMALYPMLALSMLYATWFAAWATLGHRPRPSLDDPKFIGPVVDCFYFAFGYVVSGLFVSLWACLVLTVALVVRRHPVADGSRFRRDFRPGLLLLVWFAEVGWGLLDPLGVFYWYMD